MIVLLWILNFVISCFNAWGVGKTWTETKFEGGPAHFMSWMGATMAAVGFTWCYTVLIGYGAVTIPITDEETGVSAPLLTMEEGRVFFDLAYIIYIFPLVGSGLAITTHSWGVFWRRRTLGSGAVAGYNTFAQVYNFASAMDHLPDAMDRVGGFFSSSSGSKDDAKGKIIIFLVAIAVLGGVLTTWLIIRTVARNTARARAFKYEYRADGASA